ncbi:MAG TPA: hypothetical protein VGW35_11035, partial [Methylomirabilota bacterium]|nr:hypothetical protein [Methylomirabilota bacterium]
MKTRVSAAALAVLAGLVVISTIGWLKGTAPEAGAQAGPPEEGRAVPEATDAAGAGSTEDESPPALPLPVVRTVTMRSITRQGIMDLAYGAGFLWGLDGGAREPRHFVVRIRPRDGAILQQFPAPNQLRFFGDGSQSLAFAEGRLWVLNFFDDLVYEMLPGRLLGMIGAPRTDVTSGLGFDGTHLWYGQSETRGTSGGALLRQMRTNGEILKGIRVPFRFVNDIAFVRGAMFVSGSDSPGSGYFIYQVHSGTGRILRRFQKRPCEYGLAFDGVYLWSGDWCRHQYRLYR